ncbi:hypothetical protein MD484_g7294, partial [Candolleomyces efflorescens]
MPRREKPSSSWTLAKMGRIGDPKFGVWANLYKLEVVISASYKIVFAHSLLQTTRREIDWPINSHVMPCSEARVFASVMAFFLDRARREGRVESFLDSCYTYILTRWPPHTAPPELYHFWQHEAKDLWRIELLRQYHTRYLFEPPCEWELVLALKPIDFQSIANEILKTSEELADEASREVVTLKPESLPPAGGVASNATAQESVQSPPLIVVTLAERIR